MNYRRIKNTSKTFFFTLVTYQRKKIFSAPETINLLRNAIKKTKLTHPFFIDAFVLLPDHLHCIWTLPTKNDCNATRWRLIKTYFTKTYSSPDETLISASRKNKSEQCIWQRRFWEHQIQNPEEIIFSNGIGNE